MDLTYSTLKNEFEKYSVKTDQDKMQAYFELECQKTNLGTVLDQLLNWERQTGYIAPRMLAANKQFYYPDKETGVTFGIQINYQRDHYSPLPAKLANRKQLHCPICYENIGITGKENLRVFRFNLRGCKEFFIQLTPYPLREKHFVLIEMEKKPMRMDEDSVADLVRFIELAPGYTGCSNSDVAWAGASILQHHHYQVFENLELPVMQANYSAYSGITETVAYGLLDFPIACCKISMVDRTKFIAVCGTIIRAWKALDPGRNTCNLIVQKDDKMYCSYIIFRNPDFRTSDAWHVFKTEGVGVIEVAGEGILPVPKGENAARLNRMIEDQGLDVIKGLIEDNNPVKKNAFARHFAWLRNIVEFEMNRMQIS
ncbi:MAG: hypothetical protein DWQ10_16425 [Calditrichaeota bacterium]|nr:MAG: hypothetical protein DWQ10_16425 [Calditrichota bacterium]